MFASTIKKLNPNFVTSFMEFIKKSNYKQLELESSITYWVRPRLSIVLHNKDKELLESLQSLKKKLFGRSWKNN